MDMCETSSTELPPELLEEDFNPEDDPITDDELLRFKYRGHPISAMEEADCLDINIPKYCPSNPSLEDLRDTPSSSSGSDFQKNYVKFMSTLNVKILDKTHDSLTLVENKSLGQRKNSLSKDKMVEDQVTILFEDTNDREYFVRSENESLEQLFQEMLESLKTSTRYEDFEKMRHLTMMLLEMNLPSSTFDIVASTSFSEEINVYASDLGMYYLLNSILRKFPTGLCREALMPLVEEEIITRSIDDQDYLLSTNLSEYMDFPQACIFRSSTTVYEKYMKTIYIAEDYLKRICPLDVLIGRIWHHIICLVSLSKTYLKVNSIHSAIKENFQYDFDPRHWGFKEGYKDFVQMVLLATDYDEMYRLSSIKVDNEETLVLYSLHSDFADELHCQASNSSEVTEKRQSVLDGTLNKHQGISSQWDLARTTSISRPNIYILAGCDDQPRWAGDFVGSEDWNTCVFRNFTQSLDFWVVIASRWEIVLGIQSFINTHKMYLESMKPTVDARLTEADAIVGLYVVVKCKIFQHLEWFRGRIVFVRSKEQAPSPALYKVELVDIGYESMFPLDSLRFMTKDILHCSPFQAIRCVFEVPPKLKNLWVSTPRNKVLEGIRSNLTDDCVLVKFISKSEKSAVNQSKIAATVAEDLKSKMEISPQGFDGFARLNLKFWKVVVAVGNPDDGSIKIPDLIASVLDPDPS